MKKLSIFSILFAIIGLLFIGSSYIYKNSLEPLMLLGFITLLIGLLSSFGAMIKREQGKMKFLAAATFFVSGFIIAWFEPFQILRMLTWLKN